jgi:hypothetical protein
MLGEGTVIFSVFTGRGRGHIARNRLESFAQFPGNGKFHLRWTSRGRTDFKGTIRMILLSVEFFLPMRTLGSSFYVAMNGAAAAG